MGEISMSGSTREGGAAVIGLRASHPVLSPLLYCFETPFEVRGCSDRGSGFRVIGGNGEGEGDGAWRPTRARPADDREHPGNGA